jgi:hypothetical protein
MLRIFGFFILNYLLTPKIPYYGLEKNLPKFSLLVQFAYTNLCIYSLKFNRKILLWSMKIRCGKSFEKVGHKDWKIIVFKMKKSAFFTPRKTGLANFESSWLKTFAQHKLEAFNIVLRN